MYYEKTWNRNLIKKLAGAWDRYGKSKNDQKEKE